MALISRMTSRSSLDLLSAGKEVEGQALEQGVLVLGGRHGEIRQSVHREVTELCCLFLPCIVQMSLII